MDRRAMTLMEVVIAASLLSLLAGGALSLLKYSKIQLERGAQASDFTRLCSTLYSELEDDFFHSGSLYRGLSADGKSCSHRSAVGDDGKFHTDSQGYPEWQKWLTHSIQNSKLIKASTPLPDQKPTVASPPDLLQLATTRNRVLCHSVTSGSWVVVDKHSLQLNISVSFGRSREELNFLFTTGQGDAL